MRPQSAQPLSRLYAAMSSVSGGGGYPTTSSRDQFHTTTTTSRDVDESGAIGTLSETERVRLQRRREIRTWTRQDVREHLTRDGSLRAFTVFVSLDLLEDEQARQHNSSHAAGSGVKKAVPVITASFGNPSKRRVSVVEALFLHHIDGNALLDLKESDLMVKVGITQLGIAKAVSRVVDLLCCKRPVGVPSAWGEGEEELFADVTDNNTSSSQHGHQLREEHYAEDNLENYGIPHSRKGSTTATTTIAASSSSQQQQRGARPMSAVVAATKTVTLNHQDDLEVDHNEKSHQHHHHSSILIGRSHARPQSAPLQRSHAAAATSKFSGRYADLDPFAGWEEQLERKKHPLRHAQFRFSKLPQHGPNHHNKTAAPSQQQQDAVASAAEGETVTSSSDPQAAWVATHGGDLPDPNTNVTSSTPSSQLEAHNNNNNNTATIATQTKEEEDSNAWQRQAARFPLETVVPEKPEVYRMGPLERERRHSVVRSGFQSLQLIASSPSAASAGTQGLLTLGWLMRSFAEAFHWEPSSVSSRIAGAYEIIRVARQGAAAASGGGGGRIAAVGRCRPSSSPLVRGSSSSATLNAGRAASPPSARGTPAEPPLEQLPDRASPLYMDSVKLRRGDFRTIVCYVCDSLPPHDFDTFFQFLSASFGKDKQEKTRRELAIQQLFALKESLGPVQQEDVREIVQMCKNVDGCVVKLPRRRGTQLGGGDASSLVHSRTGSPTHSLHHPRGQDNPLSAVNPIEQQSAANKPTFAAALEQDSNHNNPLRSSSPVPAASAALPPREPSSPSAESTTSSVASVSNFAMPSVISPEWFLTFLYEALVEVKTEVFDRCMLDLRIAAERAIVIANAEKNRRAVTVLSQKELEELISNETSVHRPIVLLLPPQGGLSFNPSSMIEDSFRTRKEKFQHRTPTERQQQQIAESMGSSSSLVSPPLRQHMLNMYSAASESTISAMLQAVETLGCEKGFWLFVDCVGSPEEDAVLRRLCRLVVTQRHVHAQCRIFVRCGIAQPHELPQIAKTIAVVVSLGSAA